MGGCGNAAEVQFSNEPLLHRHPHPFTTRLPHGMERVNLLKHYAFIFYSSSNTLPSSPDPTSFHSIELNVSVQKSYFLQLMSWVKVVCGQDSTRGASDV